MEKQIISSQLIEALAKADIIRQSENFNSIKDQAFKDMIIEQSNKYYNILSLVASSQAVVK